MLNSDNNELMKYVALLRGINVGGKNPIKMASLRACLEASGLKNVQTYINSGNVIFESRLGIEKLTERIEQAIKKTTNLVIPCVVISKDMLERIIVNSPTDWLDRDGWKYNYIFLKPPYDMDEVLEGIGKLKPDIEYITPGEGVLYQCMSMQLYGRTTTGKLASKPIYQQMTIRSHNTLTKLIEKLADSR